jgi:4-methyl-5(b-hydroxyethyl)-thiazole monophosphate biosynthesis
MPDVLVPLAEGFEDIEAITLVDILRRAGVEVLTAGLAEGLVRGARGTRVQPDVQLDAVLARDFAMIALPGGMPGAENLRRDGRIIALLRRHAAAGHYTTAICAAPIALAEAGVLAGKRATSYPGFVDALALPDVQYVDQPVVVDGKVVTSKGPGTAMDFALTLVTLLVGNDKRRQVEAGLMRP